MGFDWHLDPNVRAMLHYIHSWVDGTLRAARDMADIDADHNRDLVGQGVTNVAAAMTGGFLVSTSMSLSGAIGQPIVGAGVGVALAYVVFMIEMNRPIVRRRLTGRVLRSKRIRSAA